MCPIWLGAFFACVGQSLKYFTTQIVGIFGLKFWSKTRDLGRYSKFLSKIVILSKNQNVGQKRQIWAHSQYFA